MVSSASGETFTQELRRRSRKVHDRSNKLVNLKLAFVTTDKELWVEVISQFYFVFKTIEEEVDRHKTHPFLKNLPMDEVRRTKLYREDFEYYLGSDWKEKVISWPPTESYIAKIKEVSSTDPAVLLAYVYTMYFALFGGGQIIEKTIRTTLQLETKDGKTDGLHFLYFKDLKGTKQKMTDAINALHIDKQMKEKIIEERFLVFQMNDDITQCIHPTLYSYWTMARILLIFFTVLLGLTYLIFCLVRKQK